MWKGKRYEQIGRCIDREGDMTQRPMSNSKSIWSPELYSSTHTHLVHSPTSSNHLCLSSPPTPASETYSSPPGLSEPLRWTLPWRPALPQLWNAWSLSRLLSSESSLGAPYGATFCGELDDDRAIAIKPLCLIPSTLPAGRENSAAEIKLVLALVAERALIAPPGLWVGRPWRRCSLCAACPSSWPGGRCARSVPMTTRSVWIWATARRKDDLSRKINKKRQQNFWTISKPNILAFFSTGPVKAE